MTKTDFSRMKRFFEGREYGTFRVHAPGERGYTEIVKFGPCDYGAYTVYPGDGAHVPERDCFDTAQRLDQFAEWLID